EWDLELGPLIRGLQAPAIAAGLPESGGPEGKRGYVWHCSARVAGGDRVLSDAEWGEIARDLLHGAGVAARDDPGGPRWLAIRHADDHIHVAVVLVRQDTCRRFWPYRDYPRLREAAREVERRLGLTVTAAADGTAERAPSRGEREKAARQGRVPARVELVRAVRRAAIAARDVASFEAALREAGYRVEVRRGPSGDPLGYKVSRTGFDGGDQATRSKGRWQHYGSTPRSCGSAQSGWCTRLRPSRASVARPCVGGWVSSWGSARTPCAAGSTGRRSTPDNGPVSRRRR